MASKELRMGKGLTSTKWVGVTEMEGGTEGDAEGEAEDLPETPILKLRECSERALRAVLEMEGIRSLLR